MSRPGHDVALYGYYIYIADEYVILCSNFHCEY